MALVCTTRSRPSSASSGAAKSTSRRLGDVGARGVDVDERDVHSRELREQPGDAAADHAGADDREPVAGERADVPHRVDGGLDGAREHGTLGRHLVGDHGDSGGRHDVRSLVGIQAEDRATSQRRGTLLDHADVEVAVLHRPGQLSVLERRPHLGVLAGRHPAREDERLGPPADGRAHRADEDLVGGRGSGRATVRISPIPGARSQKARASLRLTVIPDPCWLSCVWCLIESPGEPGRLLLRRCL